MGLLDSILGQTEDTGASGNVEARVVNAVAGILGDKKGGGLSGLIQNFTANGLGDIVSSWVGTGANLQISADQILKGIGSQRLNQLAAKIGVPPEQVSSVLASVLPGVVDKLTPGGKIPTEDLLQQGLAMFKGKLGL